MDSDIIFMRTHQVIIAFFIVLAGHALALFAFSLLQNGPKIPVTPPVLQASIITPPLPAPEKPAPPIPIPPKPVEPIKEPPPVEKKKPEIKPPPVLKPKAVLKAEKPAAETINTVAAPPPPPPPPKVEAPAPEPVVQPPRVDAKQKDNPPPDYPAAARRMGQQGTVILEVFILTNGSVGEIRLKTSSGHTRLDEAAIEAVKKWRYLPATRGDKPIDYWYTQPVKFVLN